jgi:biotin operon repressor
MNKDLDKLIHQAKDQGWQIQIKRSGHYKWVSPSGRFVVSSSTPSDRRAVMNIVRDLKRYGFEVIKKKKGN